MRRVIFLFFMLICNIAFAADLQKTEVVGRYSNISTSMTHDPHQSGYSIILYKRSDGLFFGDFTFAMGSAEAASAKLLDLYFDGTNLKFKAKTSAYQILDKNQNRPSKELFEFSGKLKDQVLAGSLIVRDGYDLERPQSAQTIRLKRIKAKNSLSYEAHEEIFKQEAW